MRRSRVSHCWLAVFCTACLSAIFTFVAGIDGFGPIDDHQFINTLLQGKSFGSYVMPALGRFIPLTAQEYVLASVFINPSPTLFHVIGGLKAVACGVLLIICLLATGLPPVGGAILWSAGLLSIGFANAAVRLQIGEINILFFTLIFIATTLRVTARKEPSRTGPALPAEPYVEFFGACALVTTFLYKELAFVFALTFASAELFRRWRQGIPLTTRTIRLLLVSGVAYIVFYVSWRATLTSTAYSSFHADSFTYVFSSYARNDPLIIYLLLPFTALRVAVVLRTPSRQTLYDALLLAATAYVCAYLTLRIYNTYYLLPVYGFAVCGLAGVISEWKSKTLRAIVLTIAALLGANNLPQALSDAQALKAISNNHYQFVRNLSEYLWESRAIANAPRNLLLQGVNPGHGIEIIVSLRAFLSYFGTPDAAYQLVTTEASNNTAISNYYGVKSRADYKPAPDDLVVYNPYQTNLAAPPILTPSLQLLFSSPELWSLPRWTLATWGKCALSHQTCSARFANERRYTGYSALRTVRAPLPAQTSPIQTPAYELGPFRLPGDWVAGSTIKVEVPVLNSGKTAWPAGGSTAGTGLVHLASVWLASDGTVAREGARSIFYEAIGPGERARVVLVITAPTLPGTYRLVVSPIQEDVQWFYQYKDSRDRGIVVKVF